MSDQFIGIDITGEKEIQAKIARIPAAAIDAGVEGANAYLLNVLKLYPPQKSVTRFAAYGTTFFTDKQRRFFFAALRDGRITVPYERNQGLADAWKTLGEGRNQILVNEAEGAKFVQGNSFTEQSRHEKLVGWLGVDQVIKERMDRIVRAFSAGVKKGIKSLGLNVK